MWIAENPAAYRGSRVGSGQCVAFVQRCAKAPHTSQWRRGASAKYGAIPEGAAIATFDPDTDRYGNHTDGRSHAAIFIAKRPEGLLVWDQWLGQPVHQRTIQYRGGNGRWVNDGDQFYVIEEA